MILEGNQRGGAASMANHLLNSHENEHVEVHEVSGFASQDVFGALQEIHAVSKATQCRQFMFSMSLNPPQNEEVPVEYFEDAIEAAEKKLVWGKKDLDRRGFIAKKEAAMTKLITRSELSRCSLEELRGLYRKTFNQLVQSQSESHQRRNALASLETISNELNGRYTQKGLS